MDNLIDNLFDNLRSDNLRSTVMIGAFAISDTHGCRAYHASLVTAADGAASLAWKWLDTETGGELEIQPTTTFKAVWEWIDTLDQRGPIS